MKRALTANLGWLFIITGFSAMPFAGLNVYLLIITFAGFFLRLIYNSEKYKFFKALNLDLLHAFGKTDFQKEAHTNCLYGFYRGVVDFLFVNILPFLIIPKINAPWYCDWVIGILFVLALLTIFGSIDDKDKNQIQEIVNSYDRERNRMNTAPMPPCFFKRVCLAIPFIRRWMVRNTVQENCKNADKYSNKDEFVTAANKLISTMFAPNMIVLYNHGKFDTETFGNVQYYKEILKQCFGKKGYNFAQQIKIEKANLRNRPDVVIWIVFLPSNCEVGQNEAISFVIVDNRAHLFSWEWSQNGNKIIGTWDDKKHLNFGICNDKVNFVKAILSLTERENAKDNEEREENFDELDLKHRLANEIGVRFEMLDFYMSKFQEKVVMEMQGIDTSGIDSDIENEEEWLRYCQWEIKQAMKRMNN